jgi:hypothetical protein
MKTSDKQFNHASVLHDKNERDLESLSTVFQQLRT